MEQLSLPIGDDRCPHEVQVVDMSGKGNLKSECDLTVPELGHTTWTTCRVWGRCTLREEE